MHICQEKKETTPSFPQCATLQADSKLSSRHMQLYLRMYWTKPM